MPGEFRRALLHGQCVLHALQDLTPDLLCVQISYRRAQALQSLGRITDAFKEVEIAKRLRPSHYGTRKLRLQLLMALGKHKVSLHISSTIPLMSCSLSIARCGSVPPRQSIGSSS